MRLIGSMGARSVADVCPKLTKTWSKDRNGDFTPYNVCYASRYKAWWICEKGHSYQRMVVDMTRRRTWKTKRTRCPYCLGRRRGSLVEVNPEISKEWNFNRNDGKMPGDFSPSSHERVWWICNKGHEWRAKIQARTDGGTGCPECAKGYKTSKYEYRIYSELLCVFDDVIHSYDVGGIKADIYIPSLKIAIEVDGSFWHRGSEKRDRNKTLCMKNCCLSVYRFRQKPLSRIERHDILFGARGEGIDIAVREFVFNVLGSLKGIVRERALRYLSTIGFQNEEKYREIVYYLSNVKPENSLKLCYPRDAANWHPVKNKPMTPLLISRKSNVVCWWVCGKGHEWQSTVYNKVKGKGGCPYCDGKKTSRENSLAAKYPKIAEQWDIGVNGLLTPYQVNPCSHKKVGWICGMGHRWRAEIKCRVLGGTGCPECYRNRIKQRIKYDK